MNILEGIGINLKEVHITDVNPDGVYIIGVENRDQGSKQLLQELTTLKQAFDKAGVYKTIFIPYQDGEPYLNIKEYTKNDIKNLVNLLQAYIEE